MTGKYYEQDTLIRHLETIKRRTNERCPNSIGVHIIHHILNVIVKDVPTVTAADIKRREDERNSKQYGKEIKSTVFDEFKQEEKQ